MAGWASLGDVLGGGVQNAREMAFGAGQLNSAKTEDAIGNARKARAEAGFKEIETAALQAIRDQKDFSDPNTLLADIIAAGRGGDYSSAQEGRLRGQEFNMRNTIVSPETTQGAANRNLAALGKSPLKIEAVGAGGYTNPFDEVPSVANTSLGDAMVTKDLAAAALDEAKAKMPGGTQAPKGFMWGTDSSGAPVLNPVPRGPADIEYQRSLENAKKTGRGEAERTLALPQAKLKLADSGAKLDRMSSAADALIKDDALWKGVGLAQPIAAIPGMEGARIRAQINNLKSQVGFAVLQDMRDNSKTGGALGQVSDFENKLLQQNLAALDNNLSAQDFRAELQRIVDYAKAAKERTSNAFYETYPDLKTEQVGATQAPPINAKGWTLHTDKNGAQAYVSPDGKQFEEVK